MEVGSVKRKAPACRTGRQNAKRDFGKIGVLMGGPSSERKISFKSAQAVCAALKSLGLDFAAIDITSDDSAENKRLISAQNISCAFIALHGYFGEDGRIQEILDSLSVPYTGSSAQASRKAMDKVASHEIFAASGLSVPRFILLSRKFFEKELGVASDFDKRSAF